MANIEQTRAVVEENETFDGRIIPTTKAELERPVRIRSGATVKGSVYGAEVTVEENARVRDSVMARESIEVMGGAVGGEIGCPGRIVCDDARVGGTVSGSNVRLTASLMMGNVVGTEVILEDCSILGITGADRNLVLENTLCYTFRTDGTVTVDNVSLVLPHAVIDGDIKMETPVDVVGLRTQDRDSEDTQVEPTMTRKDLHRIDDTLFLTLAERLLNVERVSDRLDELEETVRTAGVRSGIDKLESRDEVMSKLVTDERELPHRG